MQNIYSAEYNSKYSKVGNFFASFGITMLVTIGEIGMVIAIMIVKTIMAAVTTDSEESFNRACIHCRNLTHNHLQRAVGG